MCMNLFYQYFFFSKLDDLNPSKNKHIDYHTFNCLTADVFGLGLSKVSTRKYKCM